MNKTQNQNGFTAVEGLLIVIIVLMIGFIGYYVWHTKTQTDKSLNSSAQTSQNQSSDSKTTQSYLTVKEWGVRAKYSGSLHLEYKLNDPIHDSGSAFISSTELDSGGRACQEYGGLVERYQSTQHVFGEDGTDLGKTAQQFASELAPNTYGRAGDYYFFYQSAQALCPSIDARDTATVTLQKETAQAVKSILPSLQVVPQ